MEKESMALFGSGLFVSHQLAPETLGDLDLIIGGKQKPSYNFFSALDYLRSNRGLLKLKDTRFLLDQLGIYLGGIWNFTRKWDGDLIVYSALTSH